MAKITWDAVGERRFEAGVNHGVLYPPTGPGVPWNGLTSVTESTSGSEPEPHYIDGMKYFNEPSREEYQATIEAFTYPDEFEACNGLVYDAYGMGFDQQAKLPFGLSYITGIGNSLEGLDLGYKIHLVYNALVSPSEKTFDTITDQTNPTNFNWSVTTTPIKITGRRPTSHFVVDSRKVKSDTLKAFTDIIYGTSMAQPRLPTSRELETFFENWAAFEIRYSPYNGLSPLRINGLDDLSGSQLDGVFDLPLDTRLEDSSGSGLYILEQ